MDRAEGGPNMPKGTGQRRKRSGGQYRSGYLDAFLDGATKGALKGCSQGCSRGCLVTFPFVLLPSLCVCFTSILKFNSPKISIIGLIQDYQIHLSPKLESNCLFEPSCSNYALQTMQKYGLIKGALKSLFRLLKCNSFTAKLNPGRIIDPP